VTNCIIQSDLCILHLVFPTGLGGTVTGYHIQNNGVLNKPYGLSEIMRKGDTLYAFAANFGSSSITRMFFPSCSDASQPFYVGIDPPPISYPDSGNYNILLTVDEGLPTRSSKCRNIKVLPKPVLSLGADKVICEGTAVVLDAGPGSSHYAWSTGATTQKINVDTAGTYSVTAQNSADCTNSDTINITVNKVAATQVDTTICKGLSYWAQHAMQTSSGIYRDTLQLATGCDSIVTTTLQVDECPLLIWFPNAFTPDGDGRNDFYKPVGKDITNYRIQIFDRWGALTFQSTDINKGWDGTVKGEFAMPDIYTYIAVFETTSYPGVTHHEKGTFMLLR
jgi:gliding motility-associated-like protein